MKPGFRGVERAALHVDEELVAPRLAHGTQTVVEPYLFEPFFSTRSRGTGLGLYICRELCERYGASIDYRLRAVGEARRNEFFVDMQRRALDTPEARLHLTP